MSDVTSDYKKQEKRTRICGNIRNGIVYFFLCLWALIVLFPFYWMVLTSVKSYGSYNAEYIPKFFTLSPTLLNYVDAFTTVSLGRYLWNTLFFTVVTTAIMLVVITLAAFAFARLNFAGKDLIFTLFLSLMMIPNELVVITNFTTITNLDLRNTFTGLILPSVTSVFYIYLLRENFAQIPDELYYAAKVDGTSDLRYLRKVMVPICKPTLITIVILKVIECWNSYLNLHVKSGETIALVGESGAGKSTILNLVIGFNQAESGKVLIDGKDISKIDLRTYRKHLAVVPQTSILFSGTIRDNITYGCENVSEEELQKVIKAANLSDLIASLPKGLDTMVGEHGGKLSGGQRQRISIARALIRDPKVIVLDEATSALDSISEKLIQQALNNLTEGRTTFIVAHRLSTIRDADRIAVIADGRCAEYGTYEELMALQGEFYQLKQIQS